MHLVVSSIKKCVLSSETGTRAEFNSCSSVYAMFSQLMDVACTEEQLLNSV